MTSEERFWSKINKKNNDECWEWMGTLDYKGYGIFKLNGKGIKAHRLMAEKMGLEIKDLCVCHTCDNPKCVNPSHLFVGTVLDNNIDKINKNRHNIPRKLTDDEVREIKKRNETNRAAAKKYGVTSGVIGLIRTNKTYKDVK